MNFFRQLKEIFFMGHLSDLEKQMIERIDQAQDPELKQMYSELEKMLQRGTISEKGYAKMKTMIEERFYV